MIFRLKLEGCALNWEKSEAHAMRFPGYSRQSVADQDDPDNQLIYALSSVACRSIWRP